jgi:trimeric autotransporter adhesin
MKKSFQFLLTPPGCRRHPALLAPISVHWCLLVVAPGRYGLGIFLLALTLCGAGSLTAAPGDSHWDRQFGLPGTTNRVYALRFNGDKLYASGLAVANGGLVATNTGIDIFDGTNWSNALGELTGGNPVIYDIGFLRNDIYVGGVFSRASGVSAPGLAKWNGTDWSDIGFGGAALAFASDGTNLYVGGAFTNAGGVLNTNIARYDGTNWHSMGGGIGYFNNLSSYVYVLQLHNGLLYAGGIFTNAGPTAATNVAVWNGSSWSSLGSGSANGVNNLVSSLAFQGDDLYAGGSFTIAGGISANGIAKWDGASWSPLGAGCKGGVQSIGILGSDIYVGGAFTNVGGVNAREFAKWDGASWSTWPTTDGVFVYPLNDVANRMLVKDGSLYIGGNFNQAGDVIANHVVRYDGNNFYPLGQKPANGIPTPPINVSCIGQADDGIYIGGLLTAAGKTLANRIVRWDGTNWNDVGGGTVGGASSANRVLAIAGLGNDVYVGGTFTGVGGINVSNIAHWDGANWWNMGVGFDSSVSVLAATAGAVYAGGGFTNVNDQGFIFPVNHIAMWDGYNWYNLGSGVNANGAVNAIAVSGNNVYVGGTFTNASGVTANRIALWNGANWASLGTGSANGLNGTVLAITLHGSDVYVGGTFTNAGATVVRGIAKWDGASWSGLGTGATGTSAGEIRALAFAGDGKLYACGRFTNISGVNASSIARWDGTKWEALGSGFYADTPVVRASGLAIRGSDIYVGGIFTGAGLADSGGIARWNDSIDFTPPLTLSFSRTQLLPGNLFKSRLTSSDRTTYQIEYSDDFQTWTPLMTNSATQLDFTNAVPPPVNRRIFRARGIR